MQAAGLPYWGKARSDGASTPAVQCHLLVYHCLDVAAVGIEVLRRLPAMRGLFSGRLGLREDQQESWIAFWLALHDLGKFAESFQGQCPDLFEALRGRPPNPAKPYTLRHDSLGMLFWTAVLRDRVIDDAWFGPRSENLADGLDWWTRACTGHHGQPPTEGDHWGQHFDPQQDRAATLAFVDALREQFIGTDLAEAIAAQDPSVFLATSVELSWWLAGLAVLADWLGSNTAYFAYQDQPLPLADYWQHARRQAALVLDASGVIPPASAALLSFHGLFPTLPAPSPLQQWAAQTRLHRGPQIHLLEDVTGAGKTEAALMLTHRLLAGAHADGFFIALPTMATANAMYGRIAQTYARLFADPTSLVLTHGQRSLVDDFAATVLPAGAQERDARQLDETASARCTAWLADHNKRALLSPAGVGTIDQALLAVLHSKHQSLRLLGLLRKVLVVDEVHACDTYMQGVLEVLLEFHARAGGSAILLSATLPQRMKQALLAAFARGVQAPAPRASEAGYPLATSWPADDDNALSEECIATRADVQRRVEVRCSSDLAEVETAIAQALVAGQCVCWVRNTVADAVAAFDRFAPDLPAGHLLLFHARFALHDRLAMEQRVLEAFGKTSTPAQRAGRLLIATQVVEQSLDVDFDLLVTDLAPIDRVIQRAGRLRRHRRAADGMPLRDPAVADQRGEPCLWVLVPPWADAPDARWFKSAFPKAAAVYPNHGQLWLTERALREGAFTMPDDARRLIEGVFGADADIPPGLETNVLAAEGQGYAAQTQAQMNTLTLSQGYQRGGIDWWTEAKTPSRLGDASSSVALARWVDGRLQPWVSRPHGWAYSSLRVAERLIAATAPEADARRQAALDATLAELPAQGRWTVLLPLTETAQGWVGQALAAARKGQAPRRLTWCYDEQRGLRLIDPAGTEPALKEDPET
ncbi:MAG: CRISPR-associated helicase Cas3' [Rubrivivax sp.]|nr:CRISPR-associated helicase Cas3' [Rubrivivax sp.]